MSETTTVPTPAPSTVPGVDALRETLAAIELDVLTSYTLADAIREGAGVTGQRFGAFVGQDTSCALGAAYIAATARGYIDA